MGLRAELTRHGIRSRFGRRRADLAHQPVDALLATGAGLPTTAVAFAAVRGFRGR